MFRNSWLVGSKSRPEDLDQHNMYDLEKRVLQDQLAR